MGGGQPDVRYIAPPRRILFGPNKQMGDKKRGAEIIRDTGAAQLNTKAQRCSQAGAAQLNTKAQRCSQEVLVGFEPTIILLICRQFYR